jgi:integrase
MKMQRKNQLGSITFNRRSQTWRLFIYDAHGKRRTKTIGTRRELPTKTAARLAAHALRDELLHPVEVTTSDSGAALTVAHLVEKYQDERMPQRYSTRRSYQVWIRGYILPRWGAQPITSVQPRDAELWLASLALAPKSRAEVRSLLGRLWDFAMWSGVVPVQRNPMSLVKVRDASKRTRKPRSLTVAEFQKIIAKLSEPYRTILLLCGCFGLRISECLALKWGDVDWLNAKLTVQRGIVRNRVGDVKTVGSEQALFVDAKMLEVLKRWKQATGFREATDWMFASPARLGRLPWSYDAVLDALQRASVALGMGKLTTHSMRHSFRSWLDAAGTPITVQKQLMRHSSIKTTLDVYGDVVTDEVSTAHSKVVRMVLGQNGKDAEQHTQQHTQ